MGTRLGNKKIAPKVVSVAVWILALSTPVGAEGLVRPPKWPIID
jgi:hypothetical protein